MVKETLKEALLGLGLYYRINDFRFRHDARNISQKKFYQRFITSGDLVFDVGANIGQRSKIFAELAGKVVAVEPQAFCVRHLKSRFRFNSKVVIETVALAEEESEAVMWQSDSHVISSMSRKFIETMGQGTFRGSKWDKEVRVPTKTLDQLIAKYGLPEWLKIDVEGYELNVLKGLTQAVPIMSFEYAPELLTDTAACIERIHEISAHYHFNYCLGENLDFVLPTHVNYSTFVKESMVEIANSNTFGDIYAILA
jgi:FkbM family methyltransferase